MPLLSVDEGEDVFGGSLMLQGFGWNSWKTGRWYEIVQENMPRIKELGVDLLWLPPPSASVSPQGYMPGQLYDLDTEYGSKDTLKALVKACKAAGISPLADIVINHRCADKQDDKGRWNVFTDEHEAAHGGASLAWGPEAIVADGTDGDQFGGRGAKDTGDDYEPAPDLDHTNERVKAGLSDWLKWLHTEVGFEGFRFDYVKGYGADHVAEYINNSVGPKKFCVGEYWTDLHWKDTGLAYMQDGARQELCTYIDQTGHLLPLFDFPLKGILQEAIKRGQLGKLRDKEGRPTGLLGWWPAGAVTFVGNHDTDSSQMHWPFPAERVVQGYAYILTHPGLPCLLWEHYFDWGEEQREAIAELVALRKRAGVTRGSEIEILIADDDLYIARIADALMLKLGPRDDMGEHTPKESDGWHFAAAGTEWAVWERR